MVELRRMGGNEGVRGVRGRVEMGRRGQTGRREMKAGSKKRHE